MNFIKEEIVFIFFMVAVVLSLYDSKWLPIALGLGLGNFLSFGGRQK